MSGRREGTFAPCSGGEEVRVLSILKVTLFLTHEKSEFKNPK